MSVRISAATQATQAKVLNRLQTYVYPQGVSAGTLAMGLGLSQPTVSAGLTLLEQKGLVQRLATGKIRTRWAITEAGSAAVIVPLAEVTV